MDLRIIFALATVLIVTMANARAELIGHYRVSGTGPDGLPYSGEVAVEMTGPTLHVVREVSGQRYIGTGLGYKNIIAVTYLIDDKPMLALYVQDDTGRWIGTWTYADGKVTGTEHWRPHAPHR